MDLDITLPDGSVRSFKNSITGDELAKNIGSRLHKDAVCIEIDNKFYDLSYSISENCNVRIVTINDLDALHILRHCLLYTSPSPRDRQKSRMPSSA